MSFEVHREPLYRRYYAPICSAACAYTILFGFILIILPLIIAYNSYDFWLKNSYVLEQPQIVYRYQTNIQWYGITSDQQMLNLFYSTNSSMNQVFSSKVRTPILRSAEIDENKDGIPERLELSVNLPLRTGEKIFGFDIVTYHDAQLNSVARYFFDNIGYVHFEGSGLPLSKVNIDGDFILRQIWPLNAYGGYKQLYSDALLYDLSSRPLSAADISISNVLGKFNSRNVSLIFRPNSQYVERWGDFNNLVDNSPEYFNVSVVMRVPLQSITYTPTVSATLKHAWIQYMSFFIVIAFLLFILNSFVYRHKLLYTYGVADIVYEKMN